ncbi:glycosyltransferase [Patescibacteria group bacterium]|nr:glycosyltransferase [Patescibacteria group bacterium]
MAEKKDTKLLSVIIPAYKKEATILSEIKKIKEVLERIRYDYEIIVVVDGRVDKTYQQAKKASSAKIRVYQYKNNKGKGYAIRYGMARAKGDPIAFIDAGMEIDPNGISIALEHMEWYRADIIVGSKRHPASQVSYPFQRKVISFAYQRFVRFFTGLNVSDTQAGLKIYRRKVLEETLPRLLVKRYAFDLEFLVVAHHLGFRKIYEAPIKLNYNFGDIHATDLFGVNGMQGSLVDTLAIIYRLRILRYYDDGNKRKWRYDPDLDFKINIG